MNLERKFGFVALIGEANVGKSSILNALLNKKLSIVSHKVQTTRFRLNGITRVANSQLAFIDSPGICDARNLRERAYNKVAWQCVSEADTVALIFDGKRGITQLSRLIVKRFKSNFSSGGQLIAIINKIDLVDKTKLLSLTQEISSEFGISDIFFVSAKKRLGLDDLKKWLAQNIPGGDWLYSDDLLSDSPLKFIVSEMTRGKIFLRLHDELPYDLEVVTTEMENTKDNGCKIFQEVYVLRESQKGIVLGKNGSAIKKISIEARKEIESFLERKTHLFLNVKLKR